MYVHTMLSCFIIPTQVGFGKGSPSKAIWLDGIDPHTSEVSLERLCSKYGEVMRLNLDRHKCSALVVYDNIDVAKDAVTSLNGTYVGKSKVRAIVSARTIVLRRTNIYVLQG